MIIKCGPTYKEKIEAQKSWHPVFALIPRRTVDNECVWLEKVNRRISFYCNNWTGEIIDYEYKRIK